MKCMISDKEIEITEMPGFYIVSLADHKTHKVVTYSIEDYFDALAKYRELKRELIRNMK